MSIPILGNEFWMSPTMGGVANSSAVNMMYEQGQQLAKKIEVDSQKNEAKAKSPAIGEIYKQAYTKLAAGDFSGFGDMQLAGTLAVGNPFLMTMHRDAADVAGHVSQQFMQQSLQKQRIETDIEMQDKRLEEQRAGRRENITADVAKTGMVYKARSRQETIERNEKREIAYQTAMADHNWKIEKGMESTPPDKSKFGFEEVPEKVDFSPPLFGSDGQKASPKVIIPSGSPDDPPLPPLPPDAAGVTPEPTQSSAGGMFQTPPTQATPTNTTQQPQEKQEEETPAGYDIAYNPDKIFRIVVTVKPTENKSVRSTSPSGKFSVLEKSGGGVSKERLEHLHTTLSEMESSDVSQMNWIAEKIAEKGEVTNDLAKQVNKVSLIKQGDSKTYKMYFEKDVYGHTNWRKLGDDGKLKVDSKGKMLETEELTDKEYKAKKSAGQITGKWEPIEKVDLVDKEFYDRFNELKVAANEGLVKPFPIKNERKFKTPEEIDIAVRAQVQHVAEGKDSIENANLALKVLAGPHVQITKEMVDNLKKEIEKAKEEKKVESESSGVNTTSRIGPFLMYGR